MQFTTDEVTTLEVIYAAAVNHTGKLRTIRKPTEDQLLELTANLIQLGKMRDIIMLAKSEAGL